MAVKAFKELLPWSRKSRVEFGNPFESMRSLVETMEKAFENPWSLAGIRPEWSPKVELDDQPKCLIVRATLPGMSKEDVLIELSERTLTIRGDQTAEKTDKSEKGRRHGGAREESSRSFVQSFTLPVEVRESEAKASFNRDVLTIELPKAKPSEVRRIAIK